MGRAPCCDKANVKKGPWSPEEDAKLKEFIDKFGTGGNWIALPQKAGLKRCGKSCRLRWLNYLRPNIKHGEFSDEEDRIICTLYSSIGSRWSIIAAQLPGRTDNDIKNYWNTKLKKKLMAMFPTNQGKFSSPFSGNFQASAAAQSTLSQFYNSFYAKSLTTIDQSLSSPQNFLYNPPLFQNSYGYQQNQEGLMDLQYSNNNYSVKEQSMLVFGGNDQASCSSSDGSLISNGFEENQKFMLQYGKNMMNEDPLNSLFLDQKANGAMVNSQVLQYDLEEVKQLISTSGNSFLLNDENKTHERGMYYY